MTADASQLVRSLATLRSLAIVCSLTACAGGSASGAEGPSGSRDKVASDSDRATKTTQAGARNGGPDDKAVVRLMVPGAEPRDVAVEVVYTPQKRQLGLMHRKAMAADAGMLFLFPGERPLSFWMKNTHLPLDMIFIRADMSVLGVVENAEPHTLSSRRVPGTSQYVLEVNAGYARRHGITEGTRVEFIDAADEMAALRN